MKALNVFAATCASLSIATFAIAQAPTLDQASKTSTGTTLTLPASWSQHEMGPVLLLNPPETDTHMAIVAVAHASDAKSAVGAAWELYRAGAAHPFKLLTSRPARNGWDEQALVEYEHSPTEHLDIYSIAHRKGSDWTVAIVDGSQSTTEKRDAAISLIVQSLRPAGYSRESFSGKTSHPLDPALVTALLDFVRKSAAELHVPGVGLGLIDHDKIVFEGGVGVRAADKPAPVDAHTLFMIASNTKSMSTLLLAELVDEDKLRWDEPATEAYPGFRLGSNETTHKVLMRHLVCACTGLPRKDYEWLFTTTSKTPASDTFVQLAATEPTSGFGEVFQYNNLMASAAGYIGAHIVHPDRELGAAYDAAMQERIFGPLSMRDTTFSMARALAGDHASPHADDVDGKLRITSQDVNYAIAPFRPAGGAWSSPHDMIRYVRNELTLGVLPNGRRLVSAANLLARRSRGVPTGEDTWYGMGLEEDATWGVSVIHHGGSLVGYQSDLFIIPSAQVGAVILTNADNGEHMTRPFMRRLLEVLYNGRPEAADDVASRAKEIDAKLEELRRRLLVPAAATDVAQLAPAYVSHDLGRLVVEHKGDVVRFRVSTWSGETASRHNDDGTTSFIVIEPGFIDPDSMTEFVIENSSRQRSLTTRDGQHVYRFTEAAPEASRAP